MTNSIDDIVAAFGSKRGDPRYVAALDLTNNGFINSSDLLAAARAGWPAHTPPTQNSVSQIIADCHGPHEARLNALMDGYSWADHFELDSVSPPAGRNAFTGWGTFQWERDHDVPVANVRVQIRNHRAALLSRSARHWNIVQNPPHTFPGAQYLPNYGGNNSINANTRDEAEGYSVKPVNGRAYHDFPDRVNINQGDVAACFVMCEARLIKDDPNGPDNLDQVHILNTVGGDWWRDQSAPWPNNSQAFFGKFKRVTREWRPFNGSTADDATLQAIPPPFV